MLFFCAFAPFATFGRQARKKNNNNEDFPFPTLAIQQAIVIKTTRKTRSFATFGRQACKKNNNNDDFPFPTLAIQQAIVTKTTRKNRCVFFVSLFHLQLSFAKLARKTIITKTFHFQLW